MKAYIEGYTSPCGKKEYDVWTETKIKGMLHLVATFKTLEEAKKIRKTK